ncbi:cyclic-nucleotide phosphodiesterase-like protein [Emericellopsis cladophorae]|uniref:Phosphodiesterase n=1 Tax=Emericellopsis cladophorae TaxID=2686198 RepID=A0A9P9Y9E5_9HYPO|nr:cyclic-nucleotide phosphodiesterase-like protein [Emericellopsis cladophorae]KAI6785740.1 cyclic-nucleotide phosphodiesterase-like protein [Emericellopsis cladophorae]
MTEMQPTLVLLDIPPHDRLREQQRPKSRSRSPSPTGSLQREETQAPDEELYGLNLLQKLITEAHLRNIAKLVVPIPIVSNHLSNHSPTAQQMTDGTREHHPGTSSGLAANRGMIPKCLELGAADVIISPLSANCIATLEVCAYRAQRDATKEHQAMLDIKRGRQRSWVGVNEERPFSYLREAMVSNLMRGICRQQSEDELLSSVHVAVSKSRQAEVAQAVASWHFSAHAFTDDELVVAAMTMFKHALSMPGLEKWRITTDQLINFLTACRGAYNNFVPYHNFRHVVDVLQATFNFLVHIGSLGPYPASPQQPSASDPSTRSPMASLITSFEALTLLITAIGHDVGHPGVNNGFLVTLNAPLAQLYNDRSVLETFHCAAYSQILRRYWPAAFEDAKMRNLMISSILATDMGLHFDYMKKLGDAQEKLQENNTTEGWNGRQIEDHKALACSLLIKCADISNVARRHDAAQQWMHILAEEFSRQASMESELNIPSSLMAPPKKDMASLARAQLSFMNLFAIPLFQGVADIMPGMAYTVHELETNKTLFETIVEEERTKEQQGEAAQRRLRTEGTLSPRSMSYAVGMEEASAEPSSQADQRRDRMMEGISEVLAETPPALVDDEQRPEEALALDPSPSVPTRKPAHVPQCQEGYKEVNGKISTFDAMRQLAQINPLAGQEQDTMGRTEEPQATHSRQRVSETTEGSSSVAGLAGDAASQNTMATGKLPMSPSTKGTSIVSKESAERPTSALGMEARRSASAGAGTGTGAGAGAGQLSYGRFGQSPSTGSLGKAEGKALKKKTSRFRMKDFAFFKRSKGSSQTHRESDTSTTTTTTTMTNDNQG